MLPKWRKFDYWLNGVLPRCIHVCPVADHIEWLQHLLPTKVCWIPLCWPHFCGLNVKNVCLVADHVEWLQNLLSTKVCWNHLCGPHFCGPNVVFTFSQVHSCHDLLLVTKSFVQLNLYVHYCNFYIVIIKIIIKIYIYDVVNFILFNEYK